MPKYDPLTLGTQYRLGNHKAAYKPYTVLRQMVLVIVSVISIVAVICIIFLLNGLPISLFLDILWWLGGIMVLLSGIFVVPSFFVCNHRVFFYDHGLIYVDRKSQKVMHWQDIDKVADQDAGDNSGGGSGLYVSCTHGENFRLDGLVWNSGKLKKAIEREMARYRSP